MAAPHLQFVHNSACIIERLYAIEKVLASGNPQQRLTRVVILGFHPRDYFWVRSVFKPAIRVRNLGAKVIFRDFADGSLWQFNLGEHKAGQKYRHRKKGKGQTSHDYSSVQSNRNTLSQNSPFDFENGEHCTPKSPAPTLLRRFSSGVPNRFAIRTSIAEIVPFCGPALGNTPSRPASGKTDSAADLAIRSLPRP